MAKRQNEDMYPGVTIEAEDDTVFATVDDVADSATPDSVDEDAPRPVTLAAALVAAQREVRRIEKASVNQFHRYQYTSAEDVIDAARRCLTKHGLVVTRRSSAVQPMEVGGEVMLAISSVWTLTHESGETAEYDSVMVCQSEKGRPWDKALSGGLSVGLSYFLRDLLQLSKGDEPEADVEQRDDRAYTPNATKKGGKLGPAGAVRVKKLVAEAGKNLNDLRAKIAEKFETVPADIAEWPVEWEVGVKKWCES